MKKYIDYRDPEIISEVFKTVNKKLKEENKILLEKDEYQNDEDEKDFFFRNILFFTNDKNFETNKTLKNLEKAIKGKGVKLYPFVAEEIDYKATDKKIKFHDNTNKFTVDVQSNVDTIVITRLGAQDSEECIELIKEL